MQVTEKLAQQKWNEFTNKCKNRMSVGESCTLTKIIVKTLKKKMECPNLQKHYLIFKRVNNEHRHGIWV